MKKLLILIVLTMALSFAAACAGNQPVTNPGNPAATNTTATTNSAATNSAPVSQTANANHSGTGATDETPAMVKAAFPNAQSFTVQHKEVSEKAAADIEKEAGTRVPSKDHHSYLAFTSEGGTRQQIGAATVVKAADKDVVIVYESKKGLPYIKEVRADGVPAQFLAQFAGKGHDDQILIGADVKANGANEASAKAIADAVRVDAITMQTLYGGAHTH